MTTKRPAGHPASQDTAAELPDLSQLATALYGSRYEILSLIGVGGGGSVYRARDVELDELVALKVLRKELLRDKQTVERFRNEVRLARRVTHRNVARVFDIGEHEGEKFLTMELIAGESLTRRIAATPNGSPRPLALREVAEIATQICAGLEAAHHSGVVHCDLKPDNVLITQDAAGERVVITDFGIARAFQQTAANEPGQAGGKATFDGTPVYISPEQVEQKRLDARTDIYSLGVVLYELLAGTPPFTGSSALAVVAARVLRPPPDLHQACPDLPAAAAQVVMRCLARDPAERFQQAAEVAAALRRVADEGAAEPTLIRTARSAPRTSAAVAAPPNEDPTLALPLGASLPPTPAPAQRIVAVLPMVNEGTPEDNYLADGLSQDLIDTLAGLKGLRIYSRRAVARLTDKAIDALAVSRELGIELLIEGTLRRAGERLRVAVRVINVATGYQIFAERFDYHPREVLKVSDALSAAVADALTVDRVVQNRQVPNSDDAVECYLRARHLYGLADRASLEESVRLFERVLAMAPTEPTLILSYALAVSRLWFFGHLSSADQARAAAERAVVAMPQRGEPYLALAGVSFQEADMPSVVRTVRRALALAPELADAHELLGRVLIETGPVQKGMQHLAHAYAIDPGLIRTLIDRARTYALYGDMDRAHALLSAPQIEGKFSVPWFTRARFCMWARDERRAQAYLSMIEKERSTYPRPYLFLRVVAEKRGLDPREVLAEGMGSDRGSPRGRIFFHQIHAELWSFAAQHELAVRSLARSVDAGLTDLTWIERCPPIVALAHDPRVARLRRVVHERALAVQKAEAAAASL